MAPSAAKELRKAARDREDAARLAMEEEARVAERAREDAAAVAGLSPWERFLHGYTEASQYLKLYQTAPMPLGVFSTRMALKVLTNPADITDPERFLLEHADAFNLAGGPMEFQWALCQDGRELACFGPMLLDLPKRPGTSAASSGAGPIEEASARIVEKVVDKTVSTLGAEKPGAADLIKEWAPALLAVKEIFAGNQKTSEVLLGKLLERDTSSLLEMGKAAAPIIEALKTIGLVGRTNPLEAAFAKMLEQRMGEFIGGGDRKSQLSELREWIQLLTSFGWGGGPESKSSLEILAEKAPEIAERFAGPAEKIADAWIIRQGVIPPGYTIAPAASSGTPKVTGPAKLPPAIARLGEEIQRAAARVDDGFFPALVARLSEAFAGGRQFLTAVQAGAVEEAQAFETFTSVGLPLTPPVQAYLRRFMNWLRSRHAAPMSPSPAAEAPENGRPAPAAPPAAGILGRCQKCTAEYIYETLAIWEAEQHDACPCGGVILRVEEGATP